ncbi:hypothetical protein Tco_0665229, partial [Tanacetum coccineum]
ILNTAGIINIMKIVSKRIERVSENKNRKSDLIGIGVNAGDSKLMLLGINLLLLMKVNVAKHKLTAARKSINLLLLGKVNAAKHKLTTATVKVKTVNREVQLQALVDGNKVIVTEAPVRRDLQLDDEEGMDCLSNATIFEELTIMGYEKLLQKLTFYKAFFSPQWKFLIHTILQCLSAKTTTWNEFSSTMASTIICLATNQKFNFSKYIFKSMVKNLDNAGKFLMYPRFVQVFLDNQLEDMAPHNKTYIAPSHIKNIFANMRRQGKDFSGRVTPLFPTMKVQAQEEMGSDEVVYKERDDSLVRAATTASSLEAEKDSGNINKTQSTTTPNEPNSLGTSSGGVNTPRSDEDRLKLNELMEFCTQLQQRVLDLENTKTAQAQEITSMKLRVKRLEKKGRSRTHKLKRLYKGRYGDEDMFRVNELYGDEVVVESGVIDKAGEKRNIVKEAVDVTDVVTIPVSVAIITNVELTLAQTLAELKSARPKTKGVVMKEPSESTPTISLQLPLQVKSQGSKDKGKAMMIEPEKSLKKKDQIKFDEEEALRLQAEFDEEDRLAREKAQQEEEANIAWDDIQAKIDADYQLAERLQVQEQQELTIEEKSTLFQQLLEKRRKFFAAKRAEEKRNRPPTRAQQRSIMCTYLKNMAGWKPKDLKNKSFANVQELFDKAMKRVNTFVDMDTELVKGSEIRVEGSETREESSSKRAGDKLKQEKEVAIDAIPLATKPLSIVDYKIIKEGKISYFQIIRADGSSKRYSVFIQMLRIFDREDLETLWKLVKAKHGLTRPEEGYKRVLWGDLKIMFEHHVEDLVWRNL